MSRTLATAVLLLLLVAPAPAQILDPRKLLDAETFWDNRDWDWYQANIPFFECPDRNIQTTYYYRWEVVTKHLTYGSPSTGYTFTEFIDRPFWSGTYGAISCPAGHQLYEVRWLKDARYARDYSRYWFRTPGAQLRNYSTWLADSVWAVHRVHPDNRFVTDLLPDLVKNYQGWEKKHFVPEVGLFWQTGHDDGMEININSRQTADTVRGAPAYRPTLNAYLWADALAIARVAELAGDKKLAADYRAKADGLKTNLQKKLWDPKREFFFPMAMRDETRDGFTVKALSLTYRTGKTRRQHARSRADRLRPLAVRDARPRPRIGLEVPDGPEVLRGEVRPDHGGTPRPAIQALRPLLLVERPVLALRHDPDPQGDGEPPARLQARRGDEGGLPQVVADLREDAPQRRQAVHRRGVPPGHRLLGRAR